MCGAIDSYSAGASRSRRRNSGFTLVEAMVCMTLIALAGSALLLAAQTSMDSSDYAFEQNLARGIANQMIDEVMGRRYCAAASSPIQYPLSAESHEISTPQKRILFDDTFAELKYNVIGIDSINNMSLATLPYGFFTGEIKPNGSSEEICIHTNTTHFTVSIIKNGNTILCAEVTLDPNCHNL